MASGSYKQVYVGCPFYKHDDGHRRITCEGLTDDSNISQRFYHQKSYEQHMEIFCCNRYICCEIYRMLMDAKYDE